jgi:hypothetical protein
VSSAALVSLVETCRTWRWRAGTVTIGDAPNALELMDVRSAVAELQIESLLALPLTEGNDHNEQVGVLILTQQYRPGVAGVGGAGDPDVERPGTDRAQ